MGTWVLPAERKGYDDLSTWQEGRQFYLALTSGRSVGVAFASLVLSPSRLSAHRLVTAVALQVTVTWTNRRYLDIDLLTARESREAA
jgi:hypothetical protein